MKRYTQPIFLIAVLVAIAVTSFFFFVSRGTKTAGEPVRSKALEAGSEARANAAPADPSIAAKTSSSIQLESNETLLDLYSFNLDFDDEEEQVLVVRETDDPNGTIRVVVADYSPYTKRWSRSWEGQTLVTMIKTFQVVVNDLIGDHNLNIVCSGMNDKNEQTMTIYWKLQDKDQKQGPTFVKVFEQAADTVLIEITERPESYKLGQSNADSWPISVWRADASSGNYLDQLKELWKWNFADKAYVIVSTERIPGASIARKMAESILDGKPETFKAFLDGTWYKESSDPLSKNALFITFQARDASVMFSGDGLIEAYEWENSNLTRYGLYIASRNQSVRNLRRLMDIELASTDSINVRVFQDYRIKADIAGTWDGRYRRLSPEMAKSFRRDPAMASSASLGLDGAYDADDGTRLVVSGSTYAYESGGSVEKGSYAVFELDGRTILDMRVMDGGTKPQRRSWIATTSQRTGSGGVKSEVLTLQSARIGIDGIELIQNPPLVLVKHQ